MISFLDKAVLQFDRALQTLVPHAAKASRVSPAFQITEAELNNDERKHASGLMRINHTGEVCAQALYAPSLDRLDRALAVLLASR